MHRKTIMILFFGLCAVSLRAQELQARITVLSDKISSQIDKKVFKTLQAALVNFVNNRKWTNEAYQTNEKINCSFLITLDQEIGDNSYKATLTVQAARPIYNTTYESPIINVQDANMSFRYVEFQPIEFNENRVQGSDAMTANLTAMLAYYVYIILGMDYDSYSLRGGDAYFQKAWNIVNNAPEARDISGWKQFDGLRNRYFLAENINNSRFALMHDALYAYYRTGLDNFYENEESARAGILNCLNSLNRINTENPNSMLIQFFFQGKSNELVKTFGKANPDMKKRARDLLMKLDVTNVSAYKDLK
ncbi:MAG: DUF4835 family protein [Bacteroidetes bacterium]|nr:MAG: DUF4835 family protein [Bacteroidota bacterium]